MPDVKFIPNRIIATTKTGTKKLSREELFQLAKKLDSSYLLLFYTNICEFCHTEPIFNACPDPKDNFLFDLALQGNAKYLVSGDKKVLSTPSGSSKLKVTTLPAFKEYLQIL